MAVLQALFRRKLALLGLIVIVVVVAAALLAPWIAPFPPELQLDDGLDEIGAPLGPTAKYWLGTDTLGRDLLSRLIYGAQATLIVSIAANGIAVIFGTFIGVTAGYLRGLTGSALMRLTDLMTAFPAVLLAILLATMFHRGIWIVALIISLVNWVQVARVVYTQTTSLAEQEFITAEKSLGAGFGRILFRHILPHLVPTVIVYGTLGIATTSLTEATLSFLGVGVQPPTPSWGNMANENATYIETAPWLVFFPGACIALLALAFNLVGDALRDILDPTLRGRH
jgi:peptide/nickel transport system permease protein